MKLKKVDSVIKNRLLTQSNQLLMKVRMRYTLNIEHIADAMFVLNIELRLLDELSFHNCHKNDAHPVESFDGPGNICEL